MKTYFWVFAAVVFVVSLARPVFACGGNAPRYSNTQSTARPQPQPQPPVAGPAQGAGILRN